MANVAPIETSLVNTFSQKHIKAALEHYRAAIRAFQIGNWEVCIVKGGKFIEAILKMLYIHIGYDLPPARQFKVSAIINSLKQVGVGTFSDSIRITIPRACEFAYDIASNRGARHDPDEVNANEMDSAIIVATSSWILAEILRYSQKGAPNQTEIAEQIHSLTQRQLRKIEVVGDRTYFHFSNLSGREVALLALWYIHPKRMSRKELISAITRHGFTEENAAVSLKRIARLVDIDVNGDYLILEPGLVEAENIFNSND